VAFASVAITSGRDVSTINRTVGRDAGIAVTAAGPQQPAG
jgi:hypothetical protein